MLRPADALIIAQLGEHGRGRPVAGNTELHDAQAKIRQFRPLKQLEAVLFGDVLVDAPRNTQNDRHEYRVFVGRGVVLGRGRPVLDEQHLQVEI
ncbi:MAG: hypothetical protein HC869_04845 [Rhodospirillales bacterium]|nr:hypothetical protein [Rhodospirillales bacterium]